MAVLIDDLLIAGGVYIATEGIIWGINKWKRWRLGKDTEIFRVPPIVTDEDKALIEKCRLVMKEIFPEGIEKKLLGLSNADRMKLFREMVLELNAVYGVNITDIRFHKMGQYTYGAYDQSDNSIYFNLDMLSNDDPMVLRMMVNTIFHEMRHALQFRAVTDSTCTYGTPLQLQLWAINFIKYIPAQVDFGYYQEQIIEADARLIAEESIKGF